MPFDYLPPLLNKSNSKIVLLVMDGVGGLPMEAGGITELETAQTPVMDKLAAEGILGQTNPIAPGITPVDRCHDNRRHHLVVTADLHDAGDRLAGAPGYIGIEPGIHHGVTLIAQEGILAVVCLLQELHILPAGSLVEQLYMGMVSTSRWIERDIIPVLVDTPGTRVAILIRRNRQRVALAGLVVAHPVRRDAVVI